MDLRALCHSRLLRHRRPACCRHAISGSRLADAAGQIHPHARRRAAAPISARGCWRIGSPSAGASRSSSRTAPAATAWSPSTPSSAPTTIMCCCSRRRRRSRRIRSCTTICPTSRATWCRSRGCPTPSSTVSVPIGMNVDSLDDLVALARAEPGKLNWAGVTGAHDFMFAGWLKQRRLEHDQGAVPQPGRCRQRSRRGPGAGLSTRRWRSCGRSSRPARSSCSP